MNAMKKNCNFLDIDSNDSKKIIEQRGTDGYLDAEHLEKQVGKELFENWTSLILFFNE